MKYKKYRYGKVAIAHCIAKQSFVHINFGRYKKKETDTYTVYDSISENDKPYCEIWLDKQGKVPIGVTIMWSND